MIDLVARDELNGFERSAAESDIAQPAPMVVEFDDDQRMGARALGVRTEGDASGERGEPETQSLECRREHRHMLIAVATAVLSDQLVLQGIQIEDDRTTEHELQILERNRRGVGPVQCRQRLDCRESLAIETDTRQVGVKIEFVAMPSGPTIVRGSLRSILLREWQFTAQHVAYRVRYSDLPTSAARSAIRLE